MHELKNPFIMIHGRGCFMVSAGYVLFGTKYQRIIGGDNQFSNEF